MARTGNELLLTQLQAATLIGRNTRIVRRWTKRGMLPTFIDPDTGVVLYPKPALIRWAIDQGIIAEPEPSDRQVAS